PDRVDPTARGLLGRHDVEELLLPHPRIVRERSRRPRIAAMIATMTTARVAAAAALFAGLTLGARRAAEADGTPAPPPAPPRPATGADADPGSEPESAAAPLDEKIKAAIDAGVAYLRSQQAPSGTWGNLGTHVKTYAGGN